MDAFEANQEPIDAAANLGALMAEVVPKTETEVWLKKLVEDLAMVIVELTKVIDCEEDL